MLLLKDERHNNNNDKYSKRPKGRWRSDNITQQRQDRDIDTGKAEMLSIVDVLFSCDQEKTEGQNRTLTVPRNVTNKNGSYNKLRTIRIIVCEPKNPWAWDIFVCVWVRGRMALSRQFFSIYPILPESVSPSMVVDGVVAEHNNNSHKHSFMARLPLIVHNGQ